MTEEIRTEEIRAEEESEGTEEEVSGINESAPEKGTIIEIEEVQERVVLVGVSGQDGDDTEDSVAELAEDGRRHCRGGAHSEQGKDSPGNLCGNRKSGGNRGADRRTPGDGDCL